jgi:hypothetical protein
VKGPRPPPACPPPARPPRALCRCWECAGSWKCSFCNSSISITYSTRGKCTAEFSLELTNHKFQQWLHLVATLKLNNFKLNELLSSVYAAHHKIIVQFNLTILNVGWGVTYLMKILPNIGLTRFSGEQYKTLVSFWQGLSCFKSIYLLLKRMRHYL